MAAAPRTTSAAARRRLLPHYRATTYRVLAPAGAIDLRIGECRPELDALLHAAGHRRWAWLTAWNPASRALPARENRRRQRRLLAALRALGALPVPGVALADAGDWPPEPSLLVPGLGEDEALALAARFGQHAVLCGRRGGPVRLRWA